MKKILILTLALFVVGIANAAIQPLEGTNVVGFSAVVADLGDNQIITVPYVACLNSDNAIFLADLVSTNGLKADASDPALADQLIVMTYNSGLDKLVYYYYWLNNGAGWTAIETTLVEDGSTTVITPPAASAFEVARGLGFWLKRANGSTADVYVKGELSDANPSTGIVDGLNLVGYGSAGSMNLTNVIWTGADGGNGLTTTSDKIIVVEDDGSLSYYYYFTNPDWPGAYIDLDGMWITEAYEVADVTIPAGQGFWYLRRNGGNFNFEPDGSN
ncbi:MAG: hypothetical protein PF904_18495 [Kiritimatiellae bacterium]|jgi:hypothetical protein|nr:hypothetical protein [Kiritimatiellia bacterium]